MKNARREAAIKREKRKKLITWAILISVVVVIATLIIIGLYQQRNTRVFTDGGQVLTLHPNGTFVALLFHDNTKRGTYTENSEGGVTTISFTYNGVTENGIIIDKTLTLPREWDDGHGHGGVLRLK